MVCAWLYGQSVAAYHGSRLDDEDVQMIRKAGLRCLSAAERRAPLLKKLASHPRWPEVAENLDHVLELMGRGNFAGHREGQVHATISRAGLLNCFNHYLTHGSEFDQHAANMLLGNDCKASLAAYGKPVLVVLKVPGQVALEATNPYGFGTEELPNLVAELAKPWSWWLANPEFSTVTGGFDCGLIFEGIVGPEWIHAIEDVATKADGSLDT